MSYLYSWPHANRFLNLFSLCTPPPPRLVAPQHIICTPRSTWHILTVIYYVTARANWGRITYWGGGYKRKRSRFFLHTRINFQRILFRCCLGFRRTTRQMRTIRIWRSMTTGWPKYSPKTCTNDSGTRPLPADSHWTPLSKQVDCVMNNIKMGEVCIMHLALSQVEIPDRN